MIEAATPTAGSTRVRHLLGIRPARVYLIGQTASAFADNAMWIAAGIWIKRLTGSTSDAGLLIFVIAVPQIMASPFAGLAVDRSDRRKFLATANICGALVVLPMLAVRGVSGVWLIYTCMGSYGLLCAPVNTAQSALMTEVVPRHLLSTATGVLRGARESLRIAAPVAGAALLTAMGPASVILLDAGSFIAAAWCVIRLPDARPAPRPGKIPLGRDLLAGGRFAWTDGLLRRIVRAGILVSAAYGLSETVIYALAGTLQRPASFVGILSSTTGVGGLIGGVTAVSLVRRKGGAVLACAGMAILVCACPLQASGSLPLVLLGEAAFGISVPWSAVGLYSLIQTQSPGHLQGRVYAAFEVASGVPQAVAIAVGAGLIAFLSVNYLLAGMAVLAAGGALTMRGASRRGADNDDTGMGRPLTYGRVAARDYDRMIGDFADTGLALETSLPAVGNIISERAW